MKKYLIIALFLLIGINAKSQNQGTNLYLVISPNEPLVVKNVYKYVGNDITNPCMYGCTVIKRIDGGYYIAYPLYYGTDLKLEPKQGAIVQTINISQIASLYPTARTAAQLDTDMQPAIDYDYTHGVNPWVSARTYGDMQTVKYLHSFDKIFVIEHLPNGTAKVVECEITNSWE